MSRAHRRCYCLLAESATVESVHGLKCSVAGHSHLNFIELYGAMDRALASREIQRLGERYNGEGGMLERGEVEWLCFPRVLRLRREPGKEPERYVKLHDLSARVGPFLAEAVRRSPRNTWPHVLLAEIRHRRTPPRA